MSYVFDTTLAPFLTYPHIFPMVFFAPPYIKMPTPIDSNGPTVVADPGFTGLDRGPFPETRPSTVGVLHLINGEHFSGAERVQQILGKRLPEQRVDAHFVCLKKGKFVQLCGLEASRVHAEPMTSRCDVSIVRRIANQAIETGADLIHAHTPRTAMIASLVSKRTGLPWVFHVHSPTVRDSTRSIINRVNDLVERWSLWSCDHIVTVSKSLRREMLGRGYSRQKVTCIPNGVPEQQPIDPFTRINQEDWTLGMVALIRPRKGIEVLLRALAIARRENPAIKLDVIGPFETPEYEAQVQSLVSTLQLSEAVRFLGFTNDVPAAMRSIDAMVLPSLFGEGMPMVVLEALALGVPVIATKVEGTPEVIRDGVEGLLAEPKDAESLASAILKFVTSRSCWTQWSLQAVHRHQSRFSDTEMARKTAAVYRKVLGS